MRQRIVGVGDLVDVEEYRAGDVLVDELRLGIALLRRQEERAVDDAHVRRVEMVSQPRGADEGVGSGGGHLSLLSFISHYPDWGRGEERGHAYRLQPPLPASP